MAITKRLLFSVLVSMVLLNLNGNADLFVHGSDMSNSRCQREPEGHTSDRIKEHSYEIQISGNPDKFVPGESYTVRLHGWLTQPHNSKKFTGFLLSVEPQNPMQEGSKESCGTFNLFDDALTRYSDRCRNAVMHRSTVSKSEVQVLWRAPPAGAGCVRFRATVIESRDVWYMDDGGLTKELCEEQQESFDEQPEVVDPCCACNEAKYEVTFEGLWSKNTHPKSFPDNEWNTFFTDLIGASHTADYRFWDYGGSASEGLRQLAEWGSTRSIESELKAESDHIRTIIKARGIGHPTLHSKTFAVFRVDRLHHLMSLVSRINPSPDWFVGVSGLELCSKVNCSWVEKRVLNLYPWDAGTSSGLEYTSTGIATTPRERIRKMTQNFPNHPDSPFYNPTGMTMKPLARLHIQRQRIYDKTCVDETENEIMEPLDYRPECAVGMYDEWSQCSVSCGIGTRYRQREYINKMNAEITHCSRKLYQMEKCEKHCNGNGYDNGMTGYNSHLTYPRLPVPNMGRDEDCRVGEWSPWSECSTSCGRGVKSRSRFPIQRTNRKKCNVDLEEKGTCLDHSHCESSPDFADPKCSVTLWSSWSPCSVSCGTGVKSRTRTYLIPEEQQSQCSLEMEQDSSCLGERPDCSIDFGDSKDCDKYMELDGVDFYTKKKLQSECIEQRGNVDNEEEATQYEEICVQDADLGPCRAKNYRWYFDSSKGMCAQFIYGGCKGNKNNFMTYEDCQTACEPVRGT